VKTRTMALAMVLLSFFVDPSGSVAADL